MRMFFAVCLFSIFSCPAFAVVADANIIEHIRLSKFYKLKVLNIECNDVQEQMEKCRRTPVSRDRNVPKYSKTSTIQKQRKGHRTPQMMFISQMEKNKKLEELQHQFEQVQLNIKLAETNDLSLFIPVFGSRFYIGQFGQVGTTYFGGAGQNYSHKQGFEIISIIDENDSIARFSISSYYTRFNNLFIGVGRPEETVETVWLHGISTKGLITGSTIRTPPFLIITGTQDYLTPIGARQTVYVFEPLEVRPEDL